MGPDGETGSATGSPSGASTGMLRLATLCGLVGGLAWIATGLVDASTSAERLLHWGGGILITVALVAIGMLMVKSGFLALRLFVAVVLPVVVWGVLAILRDSRGDDGLLDVVFGVVVGLGSALILARRFRAARPTL